MAAAPVAAGVAVGVAEAPKSGAAVAEGRISLGMAVEAGDPQATAANARIINSGKRPFMAASIPLAYLNECN
jgi:hypothetical protein